jgi:hypothetical protein
MVLKKLIKYFIKIILSPASAFDELLKEKPFDLVFIIIVVNSILYSTKAVLTSSRLNFITTVLVWLSVFIIWIGGSIVLNMASKRLGGKGTFKEMLLTLGMAQIILILAFITSIICSLFMNPLLIRFIGNLFCAWFIVLVIIAISKTQRLSYGRASFSFLIANLYILALFLIIILLNGVISYYLSTK